MRRGKVFRIFGRGSVVHLMVTQLSLGEGLSVLEPSTNICKFHETEKKTIKYLHEEWIKEISMADYSYSLIYIYIHKRIFPDFTGYLSNIYHL